MANFQTHLVVASGASAIASVTVLTAGLASTQEALVYFSLGVIGGLLPDIDADNSAPIRLFFNWLGLSCGFLVVFSLVDQLSIAELLLLWAGTYVAVRFLVFELFARLTIHRGVFHSLLAAIFFACANASVAYHVFGSDPQTAWLGGCFVFMGYVVHLLLDEAYSVDLLNSRVKRSFGSAVKPIAVANPWGSLALALATYGVLLSTPSFPVFLDATFNRRVYEDISMRLLPEHQWFAGLIPAASSPTSAQHHRQKELGP